MRLRALAVALVGAGFLFAVPPDTGAAQPAFAGALDRELLAVLEDPDHPLASVSVLAIRGGEVVYEKQLGQRSMMIGGRGLDRPVTAETLFRIASVSKLVTTLVVMKAVEDGRVKLDADVSEVLGWRLRNPAFPEAPVTLRMLLTHTSSLRDDGGYFWEAPARLQDKLGDASWDPAHRPGTWFSYANLPWGVVAQVLERATGERFDRLARRTVLEPLGVPGGFHPADLAPAELANVATLYRKREATGQERWDPKGPWIAQVDDYAVEKPVPRATDAYVIGTNGTLMGPQGGLRTSARGLARIMRMLMNRGELDGKRVFAAATIDTMLATQWRHDGRNGDSGYGRHPDRFLAWGLGNQHFLDVGGAGRGDRLVEGGGFKAKGHLGDAWGLSAVFAFDPVRRDGVIVLVGGTGIDPDTRPGRDSSLCRSDERLVTALYRRAIEGRAD